MESALAAARRTPTVGRSRSWGDERWGARSENAVLPLFRSWPALEGAGDVACDPPSVIAARLW